LNFAAEILFWVEFGRYLDWRQIEIARNGGIRDGIWNFVVEMFSFAAKLAEILI
jgi:hypothetical protein